MILTLIKSYFDSWHKRRQEARERAHLASLTDHDLADMGINRGDIPYIHSKGN